MANYDENIIESVDKNWNNKYTYKFELFIFSATIDNYDKKADSHWTKAFGFVAHR